MFVAADYPFLDVLWPMIIFLAFVIWIWLLIMILSDNFRRTDHSGWAKVFWTVFVRRRRCPSLQLRRHPGRWRIRAAPSGRLSVNRGSAAASVLANGGDTTIRVDSMSMRGRQEPGHAPVASRLTEKEGFEPSMEAFTPITP